MFIRKLQVYLVYVYARLGIHVCVFVFKFVYICAGVCMCVEVCNKLTVFKHVDQKMKD